MLDGLARLARETLAARDVEEHDRILGMRFGQVTSPLGRLGVVARLVEVVDRPPDLPAEGLVRLSRCAADGDDGRSGLLGERRPLARRRDVDERPGGRVHALAVELERRATLQDEIELLCRVLVVGLVVLVDDPVARVVARPGVDAEGRDAEVMPKRPPRDSGRR